MRRFTSSFGSAAPRFDDISPSTIVGPFGAKRNGAKLPVTQTVAGYTDIGDLTKTDAGLWQGKAMRNGKSVTVTLDYKGNVTAQ